MVWHPASGVLCSSDKAWQSLVLPQNCYTQSLCCLSFSLYWVTLLRTSVTIQVFFLFCRWIWKMNLKCSQMWWSNSLHLIHSFSLPLWWQFEMDPHKGAAAYDNSFVWSNSWQNVSHFRYNVGKCLNGVQICFTQTNWPMELHPYKSDNRLPHRRVSAQIESCPWDMMKHKRVEGNMMITLSGHHLNLKCDRGAPNGEKYFICERKQERNPWGARKPFCCFHMHIILEGLLQQWGGNHFVILVLFSVMRTICFISFLMVS